MYTKKEKRNRFSSISPPTLDEPHHTVHLFHYGERNDGKIDQFNYESAGRADRAHTHEHTKVHLSLSTLRIFFSLLFQFHSRLDKRHFGTDASYTIFASSPPPPTFELIMQKLPFFNPCSSFFIDPLSLSSFSLLAPLLV
jgi:hypothetical protein